MRDHTKLIAFQLADEVALLVYQVTRVFPAEERYGLANEIRKSAVSVASNIVEGCGRATLADYLRFLDIAHGSARELEYQLSLARRLGFLNSSLGLEAKVCRAFQSAEWADIQPPMMRKPALPPTSYLQPPASNL